MSPVNPVVSVVIPNFNHGQYICDAINSVLGQDFRDFEIIVVDDGSTDDSRAIVAQFGDSVQYVWQANRGLSAARNTGIKLAHGEFVGVLDADDMYEPDFMSTLVPIFRSNSQIEAVYCGYQFVDNWNHPLPQKEARSIPENELYQALVDGNFLVPESMLVRRRCYEKVGPFDEAFRACEDVDMWLRITSQYKVTGTTRLLTRHRILPNSMSTDPTRQTKNRLAVIQKHFGPRPALDSEWTATQRRAFSQAYLASAIEYLQAHHEERAYESFREMAQINPELLTKLNTFYELGCGEQPKGYRGDFASLKIDLNARVLVGLMDRLFNDTTAKRGINAYKRDAYSYAYLALGLLSYGARKLRATRTFLFRAVRSNPAFLFDQQLVSTYLKTLVGARILTLLRKGNQKPGVVDPAMIRRRGV